MLKFEVKLAFIMIVGWLINHPPPPPLPQAITLAMDRKDREREMVSALLPQLVPGVVSGDQVALGFRRLLAGLDDLALDIPGAAQLMEMFLGGRGGGGAPWAGVCGAGMACGTQQRHPGRRPHCVPASASGRRQWALPAASRGHVLFAGDQGVHCHFRPRSPQGAPSWTRCCRLASLPRRCRTWSPTASGWQWCRRRVGGRAQASRGRGRRGASIEVLTGC